MEHNNGTLVKILLFLMNEKEQKRRPTREQGKYKLNRGLQLWLKAMGPIWVLSMSRANSDPSDKEVEAVVEAIKKMIQGPAVTLIVHDTEGVRHIMSGEGEYRGARYIVWSHRPMAVAYPPEIKQTHMFEFEVGGMAE